jgi:hypothetical protein
VSGHQQALLVKGFLLGKDAPAPILDAIEAILSQLAVLPAPTSDRPHAEILPAAGREPEEPVTLEPPVLPRKRRGWSPEAKAAAAERMRLLHAEGKMKRSAPPGEARASSTSTGGAK